MSRLRAADGGWSCSQASEIAPREVCKGFRVFKVAANVFIEKLTDSKLICSAEANGYRLPSGMRQKEMVEGLKKKKKTSHSAVLFLSLPQLLPVMNFYVALSIFL